VLQNKIAQLELYQVGLFLSYSPLLKERG